MITHDRLEWIWYEVIITCYSHGGTEEKTVMIMNASATILTRRDVRSKYRSDTLQMN
jgi:hypothetical protein